jgi:hypothetical protein
VNVTIAPPSRGAPASIPNIMSSPTLATMRAGASKDDCQISSV